MKDYGMPFKNAAIDKMSGKFGNGEPEPKMRVQTVKPVVVKNQLKNPAEGPLDELGIRFSSAAYKVANSIIPHTPNDYMKGVLKKDAQIIKYKKSIENKKANKIGNTVGGGLSSIAASYFNK